MTLSKQVALWLEASVDPDLLDAIKLANPKRVWADDMLFAIDQHCQSKGHGALSTNMTEFNELKLSGFSSSLDFINAVRENYSRGTRLESNLPPY